MIGHADRQRTRPHRRGSESNVEEGSGPDDRMLGADDGGVDAGDDGVYGLHDGFEHDTVSASLPLDDAEKGASSVTRVVFNFVNAVVGSGILAIPYALNQAGLATGVALACLVGSLTDFTIRSLVATGRAEGVRNYEELMDKLFGIKGYAAISALMFLYDFGAMLSYLIILGDVSTSVLFEFCTTALGIPGDQGILADHWALRRVCIVSLSVLLILPLCLNRDISGLEKASQFAVVTTVVVILVVVASLVSGDNCEQHESGPCPDTSVPWLTGLGKNPSAAFGIFAFAFVAHDTAFMFFNSLRDPTPPRWKRTTRLSLGFSILICLAFAIPGYVAFRNNIKQNVLDNFAPDDYKILVVRLLFMLTMSFTYPICFFICRHIVNELAYRWQRRNVLRAPGTPAGVSILNVPLRRHLALTLSLFGASVAICCFVDKLGLVMSITGNISAVAIAFILPPLCALQSFRAKLARPCTCGLGRIDDGGLVEPLAPSGQGDVVCAPCGAAMEGVWQTYLSQSAVLCFGTFTLFFCTAQTIAQAE